jgi:hypothetical protein
VPAVVADLLSENSAPAVIADLFSENERGQIEAQTGNPVVDIANDNVPFGGINITGAWSVLSLIQSVIALLLAVSLGLTMCLARAPRRTVTLLRILGVCIGVAVPLVWLTSDRLNDAMVWVNSWTPVVTVVLVVQVVIAIVSVTVAMRPKSAEGVAREGRFLLTRAGDSEASAEQQNDKEGCKNESRFVTNARNAGRARARYAANTRSAVV